MSAIVGSRTPTPAVCRGVTAPRTRPTLLRRYAAGAANCPAWGECAPVTLRSEKAGDIAAGQRHYTNGRSKTAAGGRPDPGGSADRRGAPSRQVAPAHRGRGGGRTGRNPDAGEGPGRPAGPGGRHLRGHERGRAGRAAGPVRGSAVPHGRGRRRRHTGLDRGRPPPLGERQAPAVLRLGGAGPGWWCRPGPGTARLRTGARRYSCRRRRTPTGRG